MERISCVTSGSYLERNLAAVAYTERMNAEIDEIVLGIQIFSTENPEKPQPECNPIKFRLPKIEPP